MKNRMFKLGLTVGAIVAAGCANQKDNASTTQLYSTTFTMAASSTPRTVASRGGPIEKLMSLIMPRATAGIPTNIVDSNDTAVNLTSAWIVVKEIEFKSAETKADEDQDESSEEIKFKGPYFVNLISATPQVVDAQSVPAKVIRRIEMKLEAAENQSSSLWPADAPLGLENNSMYIAGTFGNSNTAFSFSSHDGTEFKVSGANGITPSEGQDLLMSIHFQDIIRKIDLTALSNATDKNINDSNRVSATNPCPLIEVGLQDLFTCIRKGLESESKIGHDSDGSGELESNEDRADG